LWNRNSVPRSKRARGRLDLSEICFFCVALMRCVHLLQRACLASITLEAGDHRFELEAPSVAQAN
jgi:hypothetical protein